MGETDTEPTAPRTPADETTAEQLRGLVSRLEAELTQAKVLLGQIGSRPTRRPDHARKAADGDSHADDSGSIIIEGVFDGQHMVGPDGKLYSVPSNYASKSKLVEGDMLKLTISPDGSFIFKQIGPVPRQRVVGVLAKDPTTGNWQALAGGKVYQVLTASVTYYKGQPGDGAVLLLPKDVEARWGAVENVVREDIIHHEGNG